MIWKIVNLNAQPHLPEAKALKDTQDNCQSQPHSHQITSNQWGPFY